MLNYPLALVAIALAAVAGGPRRLVWAAIALCALTAVPGVVDQGDLDARWVNGPPVLGVLLALGLTVAAVRRRGVALVDRVRGDRLRLVLAALLVLLAAPWFAAEVGFYFPGDLYLGEEVPLVRDEGLAAVHLGFHHGNGGVLLAFAALLLSRAPAGGAAWLPRPDARLRPCEAVQDGWNEQLWKRGTIDLRLPDVIRPELTWGWLVIVVAAAATYRWWFRPGVQG